MHTRLYKVTQRESIVLRRKPESARQEDIGIDVIQIKILILIIILITVITIYIILPSNLQQRAHAHTHTHTRTYTNLCITCVYVYTGCPRRNVLDFGRMFLRLNYTDITQNTYIKSGTFIEIMAREFSNFDSCYSLIDYQIHIETGRNMWFL